MCSIFRQRKWRENECTTHNSNNAEYTHTLHTNRMSAADAHLNPAIIYLAELLKDPRTRAALEASSRINADLAGVSMGLEGSLTDKQLKTHAQLKAKPPDQGIWRCKGKRHGVGV